MRTFLLALATCGLIAGGCGGGSSDGGTTPRNRKAKIESDQGEPADYEDENSVGMSDERVSRWRWKGARKDCFYVVGNKCFRSEEQACRAAGCRKMNDCDVADGAPMKVSCPTARRSRNKRRKR